MPDYGFGTLALGYGAQEGLDTHLKRLLQEREMKLAEQQAQFQQQFQQQQLAQAAERARLEDARQRGDDEWRRGVFGVQQQRLDRGDLEDRAQRFATETPIGDDVTPEMEDAFSQTGRTNLIRAVPTGEVGMMPAPVMGGLLPKIGARKAYTGTSAQRAQMDTSERADAAARRAEDAAIAAGQRSDRQYGLSARQLAIQEERLRLAEQTVGQNRPVRLSESSAARFFIRGAEANDAALAVEDAIAQSGLGGQLYNAALPDAMNFARSKDYQRYLQAQSSFTEARLRKDSGAAVPPHEYEKDRQMYFIQPGDSPEVIEQKRAARATVLLPLAIEGKRALSDMYDDPDAEIDKWRTLSRGSGGGWAAVPPEVKVELAGKPPATYALDDGSSWRVNKDGTITKVK